MTDDQQAQLNPDTDTQESAMPTEEQQTPVAETTTEVDQSDVSSDGKTETGLPVEVKERTRQEFEKLKSELRDERARREYMEQVYNSLQPKANEPVETPIYDPDTGLLDEQVLTDMQRRTKEAEQRAQKAESSVNSYLEAQEKREVFTKHPDADPNAEQFDKNMSDVASSLIFRSMVHPEEFGNKQLSFMEGIERAKSMINPNKDVKQTELKEQASLENTGSSGRRTQVESDLQELQRKSRRGDKDAILERIKRLDSQ